MHQIKVETLMEVWNKRTDVYVWSRVEYLDVFCDTVHHTQTTARLKLIHEPSTPPPEGHIPYLNFEARGPQNDST
jgi:hypothetical protein